MLPPLTDFVALMGIDLVLCACVLRMTRRLILNRSVRAGMLISLLALLWIPAGAAQIPLLAYVRGISSDPSVSLMALAGVFIWRCLCDTRASQPFQREKRGVYVAAAIAAVVLYSAALGWGNWDAYRPGWGSMGMLAAIFLTGIFALVIGLRLLPALLALAVLAWTAGLLESGNLWDYLLDPWLAIASLCQMVKIIFVGSRNRVQRPKVDPQPISAGTPSL